MTLKTYKILHCFAENVQATMFSFGRTTITTSAAHTITPTAHVASDTNTMTSSLRSRRPFSAPASPSRLSKAFSRASLSHLRRRSCPEVPTTETTETTHTPLPQYPHHIISAAMSIHSVLRILGCAPEAHDSDSHHYTHPVLLDFIMHVLHTSEVPYAIVEHIISLLSRYDAYALSHEGSALSGHELFLGLLILLTPYYFPPKLEKKEEEEEEEEEKFTNEFWCEISGMTSFHSMHMLHSYMRLDGALGPLYPSVDVESLPTKQEAQFELPKIVL